MTELYPRVRCDEPSGQMCQTCGLEKVYFKRKRPGKGWHKWLVCEECAEQKEAKAREVAKRKEERRVASLLRPLLHRTQGVQDWSDNESIICTDRQGGLCGRCGARKVVIKKRRTGGKGWREWQRCDECKKRLEATGGGGLQITVDGEEYNRLISQFGGAAEYNKARSAALKANPLLAVLEFKACPKCGKCMTCTEEVRHDKGGVTRYRWVCSPCKKAQIAACIRIRKQEALI